MSKISMKNIETLQKNPVGSQIELQGIDKSFGANQVLFDVSLTLKAGHIHALVGENGAGKSTLMNILAGIHTRDKGKIMFDGVELEIDSPKKAQSHGIMLMHQELSTFPELTVAENIFAGHVPRYPWGTINWKYIYEVSDKILEQLDCGLKSDQQVKTLSLANNHICEFARFLSMECKFIILDEPTASLTEREKEIIFNSIRQLKDQYNLGILYISHRMHEIFEIADEVSVLRDGCMQGTFPINEIEEERLTRLMIGHDVGKIERQVFDVDQELAPVLELKNLSYGSDFQDISFTIRKGEVIGMAGLLGARRTEIAEAIFGILKPTSGSIFLNGKELETYSVYDAIEHSIALVPGDRKLQGLVLGMSVMENMTLSILERIRDRGIISKRKESDIYNRYKAQLSIRDHGSAQKSGQLSGGNQQKIVLSKWLASEPSLLILDEPTRGIDVGAKAEIYKLIQALAGKGYAILLITSDMYELLTLSTRVLAIHNGRVSALLEGNSMNEDAVINAISKLE